MAWDDIFDPYGDGSLVDPMHEELTKEDKLGSEEATESDIEIETAPEPPAEPDASIEMTQGEDPFEAGYQAELERMESEEMQYKLGESAVPSLENSGGFGYPAGIGRDRSDRGSPKAARTKLCSAS